MEQLWFQGYGDRNFSEAIICDLDKETAEKILWKFFTQQLLNLSMYKAEIVPGSCEEENDG